MAAAGKSSGSARRSAGKASTRRGRAADGKRTRTRKGPVRRWLGRIVMGFVAFVLVLALVGIGGFAYLYSTTDLPDPHGEFQTQTTFIYYADGTTQMGSLAVQNRVTLDTDEIPEQIKNAVIAAENRSFWTDPGFSVSGIARSLWSIATGGQLQGGSTITQQYIKVLYLSPDRTMQRKLHELVLATKMGREMPKEEILTGYLNTIYFGRGAYGVQAAAKSYFLKTVDQLTLQENAALAAILNNPAGLNPSGGAEKVERLESRYQYVLDGMLEMGKITQAEYDEASKGLPDFPDVPLNQRYKGPNGFLMNMVENELEANGFTSEEIQGGGLRVTTTIDQRLQSAAVDAVQGYTAEAAEESPDGAQDPSKLHIALSSVDTDTGGIVALYGGPDFIENSRNWATTPRPSASTFKAFATVAGLRDGFSLDSTFQGSTFTPEGDSKPVTNQGQQDYGTVSLRTALANSINTAFVDLTLEMEDGPEKVIQAATDAGAPEGAGWDPYNRVALGAAEVSPTNIANAYGTLVDSGTRHPAHIVAQVTDADGRVLYEPDTEGESAIDANIAANVTDALTGVVGEGTGRRASELGRPVAGKTGTNANDAGDITSAWFVGATRQLSTAVLFVAGDGGNEDLVPFRRPGDRTFYGSGYPLSTWLEYMTVATEGMEVLEFDEPKPIEAVKGDTKEPTQEASEPTSQPETTQEQTPTETPTQEETPTVVETTEEPTPTPEETSTPEETTEEPTPTPEETTAPPTPTADQNGNGGGNGNGNGG